MGIFRTVKRKQPQTTQPSDGKRQKVTIVKMRKPKSNAWTTEEKTVLLEAVDEHGLDFAHIKAEYGACFGDRSVSALKSHLRQAHPDRFKKAKKAAAKMWAMSVL